RRLRLPETARRRRTRTLDRGPGRAAPPRRGDRPRAGRGRGCAVHVAGPLPPVCRRRTGSPDVGGDGNARRRDPWKPGQGTRARSASANIRGVTVAGGWDVAEGVPLRQAPALVERPRRGCPERIGVGVPVGP